MADQLPTQPAMEEISAARREAELLAGALKSVLFGQERLIELTLAGLLAEGHLLIEGLPGLGKTELVKSIAELTGLDFKRIQFTPDLLPGDITGSLVLERQETGSRFVFQRGPLFANLVLADEINRAGPKTQSALLEAMQERRVTAGGESHPLPEPFFVVATQNPVELEGTHPLPEAQLDRFLFKLEAGRVPAGVLRRIVKERRPGPRPPLEPVLGPDAVPRMQSVAGRVHIPEAVADFIARLVDATHAAPGVRFGAGPRAAIALAAGARGLALLRGRAHISFEDVREIALPVLGHRLVVEYAARLEGRAPERIVAELAASVEAQSVPEPELYKK